jgi:hypothetical protein
MTQTITLEPLAAPMADLAPMIHRQRLVVEGTMTRPIDNTMICDYLSQLGVVTDMIVLTEPVTHQSPMYGWAGWVHWETSGAHFYAWERPLLFFSVDVYTCKAFDPMDVIRFTEEYFGATQVVARSF